MYRCRRSAVIAVLVSARGKVALPSAKGSGRLFAEDIRGTKSYDSAMKEETWKKYSEWPLVGAAFLFLAAYSILIIAEPPAPYADALVIVIWSTWAAFGVDYVVKLLLAPRPGRWFIRHPLELLMVVLPVMRPLRLLRPFTLRQVMDRAPGTAIRSRVLAYVIASAVILVYTVALSVLSFEKSAENANITTMGDSLWWAIVTITTIGYGDFYPVTALGRWAAAALMIGGFVVLSMVTATVSSWLVESVTAATNARTKAGESAGNEELARLTAQVERLHDRMAVGPLETGTDVKPRKEPG